MLESAPAAVALAGAVATSAAGNASPNAAKNNTTAAEKRNSRFTRTSCVSDQGHAVEYALAVRVQPNAGDERARKDSVAARRRQPGVDANSKRSFGVIDTALPSAMESPRIRICRRNKDYQRAVDSRTWNTAADALSATAICVNRSNPWLK